MNKGQIKHSRNRFGLKNGVSKINRDPNDKIEKAQNKNMKAQEKIKWIQR